MTSRQFEKWVATQLGKEGWWALHVAPGADGSQPADIVAVRDQIGMLIDCKMLKDKNGRFPTSRIEENQKLACQAWEKAGNHKKTYLFAILWDKKVFTVTMDEMEDVIAIGLKERKARWHL